MIQSLQINLDWKMVMHIQLGRVWILHVADNG